MDIRKINKSDIEYFATHYLNGANLKFEFKTDAIIFTIIGDVNEGVKTTIIANNSGVYAGEESAKTILNFFTKRWNMFLKDKSKDSGASK